MTPPSSYFLTGALGCIGAWIAKTLLERGDDVTIADLGSDRRRLESVIEPEDLARARFVAVDIAEAEAVADALSSSAAARVIHLAGLQVPACSANPALGAAVNVVGTLNVFAAAAALDCDRVVYASSAAVYGPDDGATPDEATSGTPGTHYGVFKQANEGNARVFAQDHGLSSVGIRPLTVYGVGRDQGLTSGPTRAMKAAVVGRPFTIGFSGRTDYQYVEDTAAAFVAAADHAHEGARIYNLHGETADVTDIIAGIVTERPEAKITYGGPEIPIPPTIDGSAIRDALPGLPSTPLRRGIAATIDRFQALHDAGRLDLSDLD